MNIYKRILFLLLIVLSTESFAVGTSPWTKIMEIVQGPGSNPYFTLANAGNAGSGCTANPGNSVRLKDVDNSTAGRRHFSTILAAFQANTDVKIQTIECYSGLPYVYQVFVRR